MFNDEWQWLVSAFSEITLRVLRIMSGFPFPIPPFPILGSEGRIVEW